MDEKRDNSEYGSGEMRSPYSDAYYEKAPETKRSCYGYNVAQCYARASGELEQPETKKKPRGMGLMILGLSGRLTYASLGTAMIVYGAISFALSLETRKSARARKYVNGTPTIIMDNGKLYRANMKKAKLELSEFMVMCRQLGYFDLTAIQTAVFEHNGHLTVLPVSGRRPVTPDDMNLTVPQECICTEVIMDGRILEDNLKRRGLSIQWLQKQLEAQGCHDAKEVFLGVCGSGNELTLFKGE